MVGHTTADMQFTVFRCGRDWPPAWRKLLRRGRPSVPRRRLSMASQVRLRVVMDPIERIKPAKDSTLAMLFAAQERGWQLLYAEQGDLSLRDGTAFGRLAPAHGVRRIRTDWFARGDAAGRAASASATRSSCARTRRSTRNTSTRPTSSSAPKEQGQLVVNGPRGLRDMNEKVYTAWFPAVLRADADHARHGRHGEPSRASTATSSSSPCTAWAAARSSCSREATRTRTSCSRR